MSLAGYLDTLAAADEMGEFEEHLTDKTVLARHMFGGSSCTLRLGDVLKAVEHIAQLEAELATANRTIDLLNAARNFKHLKDPT